MFNCYQEDNVPASESDGSVGVKTRPSETGSTDLSSLLDESKLPKGAVGHASRPSRLALPQEANLQIEAAAARGASNDDSASSSPCHSPRACHISCLASSLSIMFGSFMPLLSLP